MGLLFRGSTCSGATHAVSTIVVVYMVLVLGATVVERV